MSSDLTSVKHQFLTSKDEKQPWYSVDLTDVPSLAQSLVNAALIPATVDGSCRELQGFWGFKGEFGLISRYRQDGLAQPARKKCRFCSDRSSFAPYIVPEFWLLASETGYIAMVTWCFDKSCFSVCPFVGSFCIRGTAPICGRIWKLQRFSKDFHLNQLCFKKENRTVFYRSSSYKWVSYLSSMSPPHLSLYPVPLLYKWTERSLPFHLLVVFISVFILCVSCFKDIRCA